MTENNTRIIKKAREDFENFKKEVIKSKKDGIPGIVDGFESIFSEYLNMALNSPATIISGTGDVRSRGVAKSISSKEISFGSSTEDTVAVKVSMGFTENLGDFRSARADISVERRVPDTEDDIKKGIDSANRLAGNEIHDTIDQIATYIKDAK